MAAIDIFQGYSTPLDGPANRAFAVTPHDVNELPHVARALYVGGTGDVVAILAGDSVAVTFKDFSGILPARVRQVLVTGTTATSIVALY